MDYNRLTVDELNWFFEGRSAFFVKDGKRYRLKRLMVCANGTLDLCFATDQDGDLKVVKIEKTSPENIVHIPSHDIAIFEFHEEIPDLGNFMMVEVDEGLAPLITELLKRLPHLKGEDYDAYIGKEFV